MVVCCRDRGLTCLDAEALTGWLCFIDSLPAFMLDLTRRAAERLVVVMGQAAYAALTRMPCVRLVGLTSAAGSRRLHPAGLTVWLWFVNICKQ